MERNVLTTILTSNGYPRFVIHRHSMQSNSRMVDWSDAQGLVVTLPYVRGGSEAVHHIFTPLSVKVSFHPHTTLSHLLRDQRTVSLRKNCQMLSTKLSEHRWVVELRGSHLCTVRACPGGTSPGGLVQGQGVGPPTPSPPEINPGVHPHSSTG